jgi:AraC-like DNA-binding protein
MSSAFSVTGAGRNGTRQALHTSLRTQPAETERGEAADELQRERANKIFEILRSGKASTLRDLGVELNLSKSYLQHLFKRQTGLTLGHLLMEQKLLKAAELLAGTNMRIKEIAFTVGYGHPSSFIRAFEHVFDKPPHVYRLQAMTRNANK